MKPRLSRPSSGFFGVVARPRLSRGAGKALEYFWRLNKGALIGLTMGIFFSSNISYAQTTSFTEINKTIARLGSQGDANYPYYATFSEALTQNCLYGILYVASAKKGLYTQLLAAKLTGRKIGRVDYSQPGGAGTQCNAELVEFSD